MIDRLTFLPGGLICYAYYFGDGLRFFGKPGESLFPDKYIYAFRNCTQELVNAA